VENRQRLDLFDFSTDTRKTAIFPQVRVHRRVKFCSPNIRPCLVHHNDLHREILGSLDLARNKYEFSARQNLDLGIEFLRTPLQKAHGGDTEILAAFRLRLDLF